MKNPTPRYIASVSAFFTAIFVLAFHLVLVLLKLVTGSWYVLLLPPIVVYLVAYYVFLYYLKHYIYRKIKLIYKTIHHTKTDPSQKHDVIDSGENVIEKVESEVANWIVKKEEDEKEYKRWTEYRRKYIGNVSHELKTPIFNIQGFLHSLIDGALYDENVNLSFLKKAAKNADRLQTIVEDLTLISDYESDSLILDMQPFGIKNLVQEVYEELERKAQKRNIKLKFKPGADDGFTVIADYESIRQVLINIIHNSIKYGREGGQTMVRFYRMGTNILIEVADTGIGIPEQSLPRIFDRFYRVDKGRSRKHGGSGLGLSIVKHIIEAHGQTINVRSKEGIGTTIGFTLKKIGA